MPLLFGVLVREQMEPPGTPPLSTWELISVGVLEMPFRFGLGAFLRMLTRMQFYDELAKSGMDAWAAKKGVRVPRHCFLERMVVLPEYQGKGVGTHCLGQGLREVLERGFGVYLNTQSEDNVKFYRRLGFEVISVSDSGIGVPDRQMFLAPKTLIPVSPVEVEKEECARAEVERRQTKEEHHEAATGARRTVGVVMAAVGVVALAWLANSRRRRYR